MQKKTMKNSTFAIFAAVILFLIVLFAVNAFLPKKSEPPAKVTAAMQKPFDASAVIRMEKMVLHADINKTAANACTISVSEPKTLSGMCFIYDGKNITISYRGMSVELDENSALAASLVKTIMGAIDKAASDSGVSVGIEDETLLLKGETDSGKFNMQLAKDTGSILSLSYPDLDLECRFDDFIFK